MSNLSVDDSIQKELAKTFFASSTKKDVKTRKAPKTGWVISILALVLALLVLIFRSHLDIRIGIRGRPPATAVSREGTFFIKDGKPNMGLVRGMYFLGDAHKFSREKDNMLVLVNSKGQGWANLSVELKEPMNMKRVGISYLARGQIGNEHLNLVLVDADNKSYRIPRGLSPALTNEWQEYTVNLKPIGGAMDLSKISIIKLEFGSLTAGNHPAATIFLKDIRIEKS